MKKKINFVDYIVPMGVMLVGIASIVFAILCFTYRAYGNYLGYTSYQYYGGDAYTGIQHAAADTANNVSQLMNGMENLVEDLQMTGGFFLIIVGALLLVFGLSKFIKVFKKNKENQVIVETNN